MEMTNERAAEILNPTHYEDYDSLETVQEACRMGMVALKMQIPEVPLAPGAIFDFTCPHCGSRDYLKNEDGKRNKFCGQCGKALDWGCADMVSEAPTVEPSNRWVRTADRMPDIPGDEKSWAHVSVIAAKRGSKKSSPMIYERAVIRGKTVYRWKYVWDRIYDDNDIFAWMPYPEAPKEEENE